MSEAKLEPCPRCMSTSVEYAIGEHNFVDVKVICECGLESPLFDEGMYDNASRDANKAAATKWWNTRIPSPELKAAYKEHIADIRKDGKEKAELTRELTDLKWNAPGYTGEQVRELVEAALCLGDGLGWARLEAALKPFAERVFPEPSEVQQ